MSVIFPAIAAFNINNMQAESVSTYPTPSSKNVFKSTKDAKFYFKELKKVYIKTTKPLTTLIYAISSFHLIFVSLILYKQQTEFRNVIEPMQFTNNEIKKIKFESLK